MSSPNFHSLEDAKRYVKMGQFTAQEVGEDFVLGNGLLLAALFEIYRPQMKWWAERYISVLKAKDSNFDVQEEAEDIVSDCFLKIRTCSSKGSFWCGSGAASFESWLRRIVHNTSVSLIRNWARITRISLSDPLYEDESGIVEVGDFLEGDDSRDEVVLFELALTIPEILTDGELKALKLKYRNAMSVPEMAEEMGVSVATFYRLCRSAQEKVRIFLSN